MSDEPKNLPQSWCLASLGDLGSWGGGGTPSKARPEFWAKGKYPWVSSKDMKAFEIFDTEDHITKDALSGSATNLYPSGTVLIVTRSGILRHSLPVAITCKEVTINQDLKALKPQREISPKYLAYAIRSASQRILHECVKDGTTVQSVEFEALKKYKVPIAPTNEQQRIADALDELLSDLDAGVEALQRAQARLALYRASVLKAAVQGDLTAEWRRQHPDTEPASVLLERILTERRKRWEYEQLRKFNAAGKTPPANWKSKYKEPVAPDTTNLPPLPKGWCWSSLGQCFDVHIGATPSRSEASYWGGKIPWVASGEVQFCRISSTRETITSAGLDNTSTQINPVGSVLLNMIGEGKTRGKAGLLEIAACNNQNCAAIWVSQSPISSLYVYYWLLFRYEETRQLGSGNNQPAMNSTIVKDIPIPIAPLNELGVIVELIESQMSVIDHLEADLSTRLASAIALRQSILRHAFTGQLVPQDPKDEPANELLKRIAVERAAQPTKKKAPRKQAAKRQKREK